jgi:BirA family transcriptional regulator, biotin operon repressor / biotin---[acetyl-CoA-carboxylase] ligase
MQDDMLNVETISAGLKSDRIGGKIILYNETESTNTCALEFAREGAPEGTVILADSQTAGRGRMGRGWHSPPGTGIYMSVILYPRVSIQELSGITLVTAVAAAEALAAAARIRADIKWPNDLLVNNKKICGILTELHSREDGTNIVIVGIGINVNTPKGTFPEDIANIASSVLIETGRKASRSKIVSSMIEYFDSWYGVFINGGFKIILDKWKAHSGMIGRKVRVAQEGAHTTGTVIGVDANGALVIQGDDGSSHLVYSGDVSYI